MESADSAQHEAYEGDDSPLVKISGFKCVALWATAGSFQTGSEGQPLFYFRQSARAFVIPTRKLWHQLRMGMALLLCFIVLASTTSTAGYPSLSLLKYLSVLFALAVPYLYFKRLPRVDEPFRKGESAYARSATMDRSLALGLIEIGASWAALAGLWMSLGFDRSAIGLGAAFGGLILDGLRRLSKQKTLPCRVLG